MNEKSCCFTGHRKLPQEKISKILKRLNQEIDNLINKGVINFISGGALGFDQIAASLIIAKKQLGSPIRLKFVLPCENQDELWNKNQKTLYRKLLAEADEVICLADKYFDGCMRIRNQYMVDMASYSISAHVYHTGGTAQTVRYAKNKGINIVNAMT